MYPDNLLFNYWMVILSWIMGIMMMHYLIIRLPIFNRYYINRRQLKNYIVPSPRHDSGNKKAAPVMCALVTFMIVSTVLYLSELTGFFIEYAFIAGLSTGNMSFYYVHD